MLRSNSWEFNQVSQSCHFQWQIKLTAFKGESRRLNDLKRLVLQEGGKKHFIYCVFVVREGRGLLIHSYSECFSWIVYCSHTCL